MFDDAAVLRVHLVGDEHQMGIDRVDQRHRPVGRLVVGRHRQEHVSLVGGLGHGFDVGPLDHYVRRFDSQGADLDLVVLGQRSDQAPHELVVGIGDEQSRHVTTLRRGCRRRLRGHCG